MSCDMMKKLNGIQLNSDNGREVDWFCKLNQLKHLKGEGMMIRKCERIENSWQYYKISPK
ncbi:hypothetical protein CROQUDRAFT_653871 [Cronartium quercuum f. sp. fusiforme G11]|uniref:Uncharacterized protein n=1 Tax=Cronartium quercuum f. sp. fusiforme G11 TaxID=708437 RepID=A0A9P6NLJ3_9BASI|nr:hypothetical protein CROQUDRAFT_653871 [Cronartium quercuum f. sp. fusiforme G11]